MNQKLLEKILDCPRLPSLPAIAIEVIELCRQDGINIKQIARTISNDPALTTKILRTVNSSYYGLSQPVSTISHALVILGLNSVRTLALGFSLVNNLKEIGVEGFDPSVVWRRALYSAVGARSIAQRVGIPQHEEAFLGGLLQDLGVIAMIQALGPSYVKLLKRVGPDHSVLWREERKELDLDHMRVGQALAEHWKLPPVLVAPIRYHENPEESPSDVRQMLMAVSLGAKAADIFLHDNARAKADDYFVAARQMLKIDQNTSMELLETIKQGTAEMGKLFEISSKPSGDPNAILAEANEALLELSLKTQQNATHLEALNKQLQQKADHDALTGASNRGRFNEFIRQHFDQATRQTQPLSMILMDADKFKTVNDTHGHLAGDQVLIALAKTLMAHAPDGALVARYGGEEFSVLLPNTERRDAAKLAENLRLAIQETAIEAGPGLTLRITASMGVATYDGLRFFKGPEQLIKAADQAVYAAKSGGRNCVRVFAPKVPRPAAVTA
jgi:two-component system cell cycle response regulator